MTDTDKTDREQALRSLNNSSSHVRLKSARALSNHGTVGDIPALRKALRIEPVSFVKRALDQAISRLENGGLLTSNADLDDADSPLPERYQYTKAVAWVTGSLLHEIHPKLGAIRLAARRATENYEQSKLKERIDALDAVLRGIEDLRKASANGNVEQFNIHNFLASRIAEEVPGNEAVSAVLQGPPDLVAIGQPHLLTLAVSNALRNAIEATLTVGSRARPIVISFNETDVDYWITILDDGPGIAGPTEAAFEIGRTTKSGHRGFGLSIARQAMTTIDGSISLQPSSAGGARIDLRWFK